MAAACTSRAKSAKARVSRQLPGQRRAMTKPALLIVEDDEDIRTQMKWALGIRITRWRWPAIEPKRVRAFTSSRPLVTLLDLGLPPRPNEPEEGLATLSSLLAIDPLAKVIIVSGQGEKENALRAVGAGAYDFLCKPVQMDELKLVLQRCVYVAELEQEYRAMQQGQRAEVFEDMLGSSPPMQTVFTFIRKVAPTSAPVLILGESGTGKEMVAQALHRRSPQNERPVHRHQLQRHSGEPARERAVRTREGRVHGRAHAAQGSHRIGVGRHAVPRRDRRAAAVGAGEAAALSSGKAVPASRRPAGDSERHARDCGHQRQPAGVGRARARFAKTCTSASRWWSSRCRRCRERGDDVALMAKEFLRRYGAEHEQDSAGVRAGRAARHELRIRGPGMSASCRTACSGR